MGCNYLSMPYISVPSTEVHKLLGVPPYIIKIMHTIHFKPSCVLLWLVTDQYYPYPSWFEAETKWLPFSRWLFKWIFLNKIVCILIEISWMFVPCGPNNNIPVLVQIIAWRQPDANRLSEPMMIRFATHICITRPQWVNWYCGNNTIASVPEK